MKQIKKAKNFSLKKRNMFKKYTKKKLKFVQTQKRKTEKKS